MLPKVQWLLAGGSRLSLFFLIMRYAVLNYVIRFSLFFMHKWLRKRENFSYQKDTNFSLKRYNDIMEVNRFSKAPHLSLRQGNIFYISDRHTRQYQSLSWSLSTKLQSRVSCWLHKILTGEEDMFIYKLNFLFCVHLSCW